MYLMSNAQGPEPGTGLVQSMGLGCASCGGGCGMGLFDGGPSAWGGLEWGMLAVGAYMVASTVFTTGRAVRRVRAIPGERRRRKAAALRARANELSKKK